MVTDAFHRNFKRTDYAGPSSPGKAGHFRPGSRPFRIHHQLQTAKVSKSQCVYDHFRSYWWAQLRYYGSGGTVVEWSFSPEYHMRGQPADMRGPPNSSAKPAASTKEDHSPADEERAAIEEEQRYKEAERARGERELAELFSFLALWALVVTVACRLLFPGLTLAELREDTSGASGIVLCGLMVVAPALIIPTAILWGLGSLLVEAIWKAPVCVAYYEWGQDSIWVLYSPILTAVIVIGLILCGLLWLLWQVLTWLEAGCDKCGRILAVGWAMPEGKILVALICLLVFMGFVYRLKQQHDYQRAHPRNQEYLETPRH